MGMRSNPAAKFGFARLMKIKSKSQKAKNMFAESPARIRKATC